MATLSLSQLVGRASDVVQVDQESLCISRVYMWQNNMPTTSSHKDGQHLTVHIKRTPGTGVSLSQTAPIVQKLHVFQIGSLDELAAFATQLEAADVDANDASSRHFAWPTRSPGTSTMTTDTESARSQRLALLRPIGWRGPQSQEEMEFQAWDGPHWDGPKDFVALVEFDSGVVLRSDVQSTDVVY